MNVGVLWSRGTILAAFRADAGYHGGLRNSRPVSQRLTSFGRLWSLYKMWHAYGDETLVA